MLGLSPFTTPTKTKREAQPSTLKSSQLVLARLERTDRLPIRSHKEGSVVTVVPIFR